MTEPRELSYLIPVDVLAEVNTAVTVLERVGPVVTEALRQLDRATTVGRRAANSRGDQRRLAGWSRDRDRPWLGGGLRLVSILDLPAQDIPPT